jgi:hypothetical protein
MVQLLPVKKLVLLPQLFWGCVAMLHTPFVLLYDRALTLTLELVTRLNLEDAYTQQVRQLKRTEFPLHIFLRRSHATGAIRHNASNLGSPVQRNSAAHHERAAVARYSVAVSQGSSCHLQPSLRCDFRRKSCEDFDEYYGAAAVDAAEL